MSKFIIGIDPGSELAATTMFSPNKFKSYKFKKKNGDFNFEDFNDFLCGELNDFSHNMDDEWLVDIYIEDVHSVYGASAKANFQFGRSVGIIRGMTEIWTSMGNYKSSIQLVQPKVWQKEVRQPEDIVKGDNKATALNTVKRILGDNYSDELFLPTKRSKKPSHDMVDSYLIAYYGYIKSKEI